MTRARRAFVTSVFGYAQYALAIVVGIVLVPMILGQVDLRVYGLWLACADLLGYVGLLDFGIFGVLPWLLAEADGRGDEPGARRVLSSALAVAIGVSLTGVIAAAGLWSLAVGVLDVGVADRAALAGPLLVLVAGTCVSVPLNVFAAALAGMQDVTFTGLSAMARLLLNAALTVALLLAGFGLYAVAIGSVVPPVALGLASVFRLRGRFPSLAGAWPWPTLTGVLALGRTSIGAWLGAFGWRLMSTSNGVLLVAVGHPELVPLYSCTSRLSMTLSQMGWIVPDSGLVPLAQLFGEGNRARLRQVVEAMLRLHLIIAGGSVTILLAINPAFVSWWVSEALYGGDRLNLLLAAGVIVGAMTHAVATVASVLGRRLEVGAAALANGVLQVAIAYVLTRAVGFQGLAVAAIVAGLVTMLPAGSRLLAVEADTHWRASAATLWAWTARTWWLFAAAAAIGLAVPPGAVWLAATLWAPVGCLYLWAVRPFYVDLPLDPKLRTWLVRARLVPAPAGAPALAAER